MQSSPNSALLAFPLGEHRNSFVPFMTGWLNYLNVVVKLSDDFPDAEAAFPNAFWNIDRDTENLFFSTPLLSLLNRVQSKRVYFLGSDITSAMETNIRLARCLELDPVLVWDSGALGSLPIHDEQRLLQYCAITEASEFVEGFDRGRVDFLTPPREFA